MRDMRRLRRRPHPRRSRSRRVEAGGDAHSHREEPDRAPASGFRAREESTPTGFSKSVAPLSVWGDGGWSDLVRRGKQANDRFDDRLVTASAQLTRRAWPDAPPEWVTFVPSLRNPELVAHFAERLAASLGLPCEDVVTKVRETEPQKTMQNSEQRSTPTSAARSGSPQVSRRDPCCWWMTSWIHAGR